MDVCHCERMRRQTQRRRQRRRSPPLSRANRHNESNARSPLVRRAREAEAPEAERGRADAEAHLGRRAGVLPQHRLVAAAHRQGGVVLLWCVCVAVAPRSVRRGGGQGGEAQRCGQPQHQLRGRAGSEKLRHIEHPSSDGRDKRIVVAGKYKTLTARAPLRSARRQSAPPPCRAAPTRSAARCGACATRA